MDVILSGRRLSAREALDAGLVARVVAREAWLDEAKRVARDIAAKGPVASQLAKEAVVRADEGPLSLGIDYERRLLYLAFSSEDARGHGGVRGEAAAAVRRPVAAPPMRRILVATDRSETAEHAVRFAADMAVRFEAELLLCQVVIPPAQAPPHAKEELTEYGRLRRRPRARGDLDR